MFLKKAGIVPSLGYGDIYIIRYRKLMVVHSASRFMQQIGKKRIRLQFKHTNYVCLMLTGNKYVHTTIHDFKIWFRGLLKLHVFLMGNSQA